MKVVLDTNVLVSARIGKIGKPAQILKTLLQAEPVIELLTFEEQLAELERVLHYPRIRKKYKLTSEDIVTFIQSVRNGSTLITLKTAISGVSQDPDDDMFLACAVDGEADYLVSGDPDLLGLQEYQGTKIVPPSVFLEMLHKQGY